MFAPRRLVEALAREGVEYVILGGLAMTMHGSLRATFDLDICYRRERDNLRGLALALGPLRPRLRDFPPELPFFFDEATLRSGLNFTLRMPVVFGRSARSSRPVSASHTFASPRAALFQNQVAVTIRRPSGLNATPFTGSLNLRPRSCRPVVASQTLAVPSSPPVTMRDPSALNDASVRRPS